MGMIAFGVVLPVYLLNKQRKIREQRRIEHEAFKRHMHEMMAAMFKSTFDETSYPKWAKLEQATRDRIMKVVALVERGIDGEKTAAKNRLNVMLGKYELTINDIPNVEVASRN